MEENTSAYATVAGFFLDHLERLPVVGDRIEESSFVGEVVDMDGNRIDKVMLRLVEPLE